MEPANTIGLISTIAVLMIAGLSIATGGGWYLRNRQQRRLCVPGDETPTGDSAAQPAASPQHRNHPPLRVRELSAVERLYFTEAWAALQSAFVDDPRAAVANADTLIQELLRCRGYPVDEVAELDELCSHYPNVLVNYRKAHLLAADGDYATLEGLREAIIRYRSLCATLVQLDETVHQPAGQADLESARR